MTSSLASYIPREVRYALASGRTPDTNTNGAALFSDISGFTPFTLALTEEFGSERGAEELAHHMAVAFDLLVGEVHRFGGSVIGFAGDAVTCWFEAGEAGMAEASLRATAAAIGMRDALTGFEISSPGGSVFSLSVKVAVAAGEARRFYVGNPSSQRLAVIAGSTINRMADADHMAEGGEALLSEEVAESLQDALDITKWKSSGDGHRYAVVDRLNKPVEIWKWDKEPELPPDELRKWVVNDIYDQVSRGREEFMGTFRRVASVFLSFDGIDYDNDPKAEQKLDAFVREVQTILGRYEGQVIDLNIGDKGSHFSLGFGAIREYEDLARRAVTAAEALIQMVKNQPDIKSSSIGIAYANAYAGSYGCERRRTFGILSNQVIMAARLMTKAGNFEVLVSPKIAEGASASYRFKALPADKIKGFDGDYQAHLLLEPYERQPAINEQAFAMVGRAKEKKILQDALTQVAVDSKGSLLVIEGEAGMGKSTLMQVIRGMANAAGLRVLRGGAQAIHRSSSYHVWRPVLESIVGLDAATKVQDERHSQCARYLESMGDDAVKLLPLLNPVLGLTIEDNETTQGMEAAVRADNTNDLLLRIMRSCEDKMALILEDLHWFDSSSVSLLNLATKSLPSSLIIVTRRPQTEEMASGEMMPAADILRLSPLSEDETMELLKNALGVTELQAEIVRLIMEKAEGSPFFSKELAYALRDAAVIEFSGNECHLAHGIHDLAELDFPDTIQGVIASRLDQLPIQQQMAVKVASVIGRIFGVRLLNDVHPIEEDKAVLQDSLEKLEQAEVAHEESDAPELSYLFNHVLTQEVAYGRLLHEQRAQLHRRVGEWFEQHPTGDFSSDLPLLAHHFGHAVSDTHEAVGNLGKALDYLGQAGLQALRAYMNHEAVHFYSTAIELAQRHGHAERAQWHAGLAHAHQSLGEFHMANEHAIIAFELIDMPFPRSKLGMVWDCLANVARIITRMAGRRSLFPYWESTNDSEITWTPEDPMLLLRVFAKSLFLKNEVLAMVCANVRSLYVSEHAGPMPEVALSYGHAAMTIDFFGMVETAAAFYSHAIEMAKESQSPSRLVAIHIMRGMSHLGNAELDLASKDFEFALEAAAELGDEWQWGEAQAILADLALMRGHLDDAAKRYGELRENAELRGLVIQQAWSLRPPVMLALEEGRAQEAIDLIDESQSLLESVDEKLIQIDALGFRAKAHVMLGDKTAAVDAIGEAFTIIPTVSPPVVYPRYFGFRALAEACMTLFESDPDSSVYRKNARSMLRYLGEYAKSFEYARARHALIRGWYLAVRGSNSNALKYISHGICEAEKLGLEPELMLGSELLEKFTR